MKISLRWLCDHLDVTWVSLNVQELVHLFNTKTAEIEHVEKYKLDLSKYSLIKIEKNSEETVQGYAPEWQTTLTLPARTDLQLGAWYMVQRKGTAATWVSYTDIHAEQGGLLGAFHVEEAMVKNGTWRDQIETEDVIFEIDNKSITHRPDLWGHRGIAREVAALLDVSLRPEQELYTSLPAPSSAKKFLAVTTPVCSAAGVVFIEAIEHQPSALSMAFRLIRIGNKHHAFIIDATNYAMFDVGHPMHAFDADTIHAKKLIIRTAYSNEVLTLLDGTQLTFTNQDTVVADDTKILSLAGIKGGKDSGISSQTGAVLLEAALFDAGTIRLNSVHHKVRTDASARFEKSLDAQGIVRVLGRYLMLLDQYGIEYTQPIFEWQGTLTPTLTIRVNHRDIEKALGVTLSPEFVCSTLEKLEFVVNVDADKDAHSYSISVPSYRATKDVTIKEDIIEEIGRFYGYTRLGMEKSYHGKQPAVQQPCDSELRSKECLVTQAHMQEVLNYALFDNEWIAQIGWPIKDAIRLKNPLSEQRTTLVTSLVPHLLQNISHNNANHDTLSFFEWARTWRHTVGVADVQEQHVLAGIWYERKQKLDFYTCKEYLINLFEMLDLSVTWESLQQPQPWTSLHQVAQLKYQDTIIGLAGMVNRRCMSHLDSGSAFVFELDAQFLASYQPAQRVFMGMPKYQASCLDVTICVPYHITVDQLTSMIKAVDSRIFEVALHATFVKPEWTNKKSITMRFFVRDEHTTLDKQEIDHVYKNVVDTVSKVCRDSESSEGRA